KRLGAARRGERAARRARRERRRLSPVHAPRPRAPDLALRRPSAPPRRHRDRGRPRLLLHGHRSQARAVKFGVMSSSGGGRPTRLSVRLSARQRQGLAAQAKKRKVTPATAARILLDEHLSELADRTELSAGEGVQ